MNARRDELIGLAAKTLDCEGKTAHGHWIYRDPHTGLWVVSDSDMEALGVLVRAMPEDADCAVACWCDADTERTAIEVDVGAMVRAGGFTADTDLDAAATIFDQLSGPHCDGRGVVLGLVFRFFRQDVVDTIRINSEIATEVNS